MQQWLVTSHIPSQEHNRYIVMCTGSTCHKMMDSSMTDLTLLALWLQPLLITLNHDPITITHSLRSLFMLIHTVSTFYGSHSYKHTSRFTGCSELHYTALTHYSTFQVFQSHRLLYLPHKRDNPYSQKLSEGTATKCHEFHWQWKYARKPPLQSHWPQHFRTYWEGRDITPH
jgi:hypothetical protein